MKNRTIATLSRVSLKFFIIAGVMAAIMLALAMPMLIRAETFNTAVMPVIYNQNNQTVNTGTGYLPAGLYYLPTVNSSASHQIEYYGNGTYYDPTILEYGGSVNNPKGTAAASLSNGNYSANYTTNYATYTNTIFGTGMATMPVLTNQNGVAVNSNSGYLTAGTYYLGGHQIEYYGNGTYYNPSTMTYGGSITNPKGTAGASLGYSA